MIDFDKDEFRTAWMDRTFSVTDIALMFSMSADSATRHAGLLGLPGRKPFHRPKQNDPTPSEIKERAALVRAKWSPAEFELRSVSAKSLKWVAPSYIYNSKTGVFSS
jgi:hypothetical protein